MSIGGVLDGAASYFRAGLGLGNDQGGLSGSDWQQYAQKSMPTLAALPGGGGGVSGFPEQPGGGGGGYFPDQPGGGFDIGSLGQHAADAGSAAFALFHGAPDPLKANPAPPGQATPSPSPGTGGGPSTGLEPDVARWASQTQQTFGDLLDPDIMLAIMTNESHGQPGAHNASGASGLFQLMPGAWATGEDPFNPTDQMAAARRLAQEKLQGVNAAYALNGLNPDARTRARDFALAWAGHFDYKTGLPNPNSVDNWVGGETADQLATKFLSNYDKIKAGRQQAPAPSTVPANPGANANGTPATAAMNSIWGTANGPITQEFGVVEPGIDQSIYNYGAAYGVPQGHTGLDIGVPRGTKMYMPTGYGGTVIERAPGYYRDEDYGDDGQSYARGELRIQLDNGWQLILGHDSQINVRPGQRVNPGDLLGLSGSANGDHIHLELRIPDASLPSGWRIVDPRLYLR